jgi:hypothetical protein
VDRTLTETKFLNLLAREAPAEEYDEALRAAVAEGGSFVRRRASAEALRWTLGVLY